MGSNLGKACRVAPVTMVLLTFLLLAGCGDDGEGALFVPAYPLDEQLRLNHIQVLGSHNSYHIEPVPELLAQIASFNPDLADSFEYTHVPLAEQFSAQGIRQVELDVFADPAGGLYSERLGLFVVYPDPPPSPPELGEPGFKVLHVQDLDFDTTCLSFMDCLETIRAWSDVHPGHVPIMILVEAKDDPLPVNGFTIPLPIGPAELDVLDAEIRSVFPPEHLITPDDVRGDHATLEQAIRADGWPTLGASRGRVLFMLDNGGQKRADYLSGHPELEGRVMFVSSLPGEDAAAFAKLNDPVADFDLIQELVADGFVVRTRADSDTDQARSGDTTWRDAALASGAQWISTDYPVPDPRFGTGYEVSIPDGTPGRCNPISAPAECVSVDIEDPANL